MPDPVKVTERILNPDTYKKWAIYVGITILALVILLGLFSIWNFFKPKPPTQTHKPTLVVTPFAKTGNIDQSNEMIQVEDKPWEVGLGGAGINYDGKNGAVIGGWVRRRW